MVEEVDREFYMPIEAGCKLRNDMRRDFQRVVTNHVITRRGWREFKLDVINDVM
jgi:hypothetical protein